MQVTLLHLVSLALVLHLQLVFLQLPENKHNNFEIIQKPKQVKTCLNNKKWAKIACWAVLDCPKWWPWLAIAAQVSGNYDSKCFEMLGGQVSSPTNRTDWTMKWICIHIYIYIYCTSIYDVMWCDAMWCNVMWCDVVWCGVMWWCVM